jgi:hypothetical protein
MSTGILIIYQLCNVNVWASISVAVGPFAVNFLDVLETTGTFPFISFAFEVPKRFTLNFWFGDH